MRALYVYRAGSRTPEALLGEGVVYSNGWVTIMWGLGTPFIHSSTHPDLMSVITMYGGADKSTDIVYGDHEPVEALSEQVDPILHLRLTQAKHRAVSDAMTETPWVPDPADIDLMCMDLGPVVTSHDTMVETLGLYEYALTRIRNEYGQVCGEFDTCTHGSCRASYSAWQTASDALGDLSRGETYTPVDGVQGEGEVDGAQGEGIDPNTTGAELYRMGVSLSLARRTLAEVSGTFQRGANARTWEELVARVADVVQVIDGSLQDARADH